MQGGKRSYRHNLPEDILLRKYADEFAMQDHRIVLHHGYCVAGGGNEQEDRSDCSQQAAPTEQMHVLVSIHGAGDSDRADYDEQVDDTLAYSRRWVHRPKSGETREPDHRQGQDAPPGKAALAPAAAE